MAERHDDDRDVGLLARWSRRKHGARRGEETAEPATIEQDVPASDTQAIGQAEPPELPDPATLDASSDFKPFLKPGVPVETQRAALRRLWRLDPIYNRIDGLDDYCEDYTDQAKVVKGLRTAYRVGRGMLAQLDKAAEAAPGTDTAPKVEQAEGQPDKAAPLDPPAPSVPQRPIQAACEPTAQEGPRRRPLPRRS